MTTRTYSPWLSWKTLDRLHSEMNELFSNGTGRTVNQMCYPLVRIHHNADEVLVTAELPGFDQDDFEITVNKDRVTLSGKRAAEELPEGTVRHLDERGQGSFERSIKLPFPVSPQGAEATYARGILTIKLVRPEDEKPHRISVKKG